MCSINLDNELQANVSTYARKIEELETTRVRSLNQDRLIWLCDLKTIFFAFENKKLFLKIPNIVF